MRFKMSLIIHKNSILAALSTVESESNPYELHAPKRTLSQATITIDDDAIRVL